MSEVFVQAKIEDLLAKDIMVTELTTLRPTTGIFDAIQALLDNRISGAPVVDHYGEIVGILSEKDCLAVVAQVVLDGTTPLGEHVRHYMTTNITTVTPEAGLSEISNIFLSHPFRRLPVVDTEGLLIGQISRRDVLAGLQRVRSQASGATGDRPQDSQ